MLKLSQIVQNTELFSLIHTQFVIFSETVYQKMQHDNRFTVTLLNTIGEGLFYYNITSEEPSRILGDDRTMRYDIGGYDVEIQIMPDDLFCMVSVKFAEDKKLSYGDDNLFRMSQDNFRNLVLTNNHILSDKVKKLDKNTIIDIMYTYRCNDIVFLVKNEDAITKLEKAGKHTFKVLKAKGVNEPIVMMIDEKNWALCVMHQSEYEEYSQEPTTIEDDGTILVKEEC